MGTMTTGNPDTSVKWIDDPLFESTVKRLKIEKRTLKAKVTRLRGKVASDDLQLLVAQAKHHIFELLFAAYPGIFEA